MEKYDIDKIYEFLEPRIQRFERREKEASDRKTIDEVFDQSTLLALYKLISDGTIDIVDFPISTGKEGNVFRANAGKKMRAIKIYRIATSTFKSLSKYVIGDSRFKRPRNRREMVYTWAQKEYKNLVRAKTAGINVPDPITYHKNVLVMKYIGTKNAPAPLLKDVVLEEPKKVFNQVIDMIRGTYKEAGLIHGDFSEFNMLYYRKKVFIIDWAQAVVTNHPMANEWFDRDIKNIVRYFKRLGVQADIKEIKERITEN